MARKKQRKLGSGLPGLPLEVNGARPPGPGRQPRRARTAGRLSAAMRASRSEAAAGSSRKSRKKSAAGRKVAVSGSTRAAKPKDATTKTTRKSRMTNAPVKKSSKKTSPKMTSQKALATGVSLDAGRQRRAKSALKQSRVQEAGITSRQLGRTSARTKRVQARRDARN